MLGEVQLHWPRSCQLKTNSSKCYGTSGEDNGRVLLFCDVTSEHSLQIELSQQATQRLIEMAEGWQAEREVKPEAGLTAQELRILRLVGRGLSNEEISRELHVATSTVRTHLKHCYAKLKLSSRSEAIALAIRQGLV
jgi:ATP/maltotriose-dependent transcriptional regulator MalT